MIIYMALRFKNFCEREHMANHRFTIPTYDMVGPIVGPQGSHMKVLEELVTVDILHRDTIVDITGSEESVQVAMEVLDVLLYLFKNHIKITDHHVRTATTMILKGEKESLFQLYEDTINVTVKGNLIIPKTVGQKQYVDSIRRNTITFGIGPAGTGKTYLAVALAAFYLKNREVDRIILTRPAVEAGEKLGYLPGDLQEKVDPYLRPLYDALHDMFGVERVQKMLLQGTIEVAPLAYMRGRTLERSFVILDEGQNTTPEQMKMFLTRLGYQSKMVVNGDPTQIDLPPKITSGLIEAEQVLQRIKGIRCIYFSDQDVVRHDLVGRIVKAYEEYQLLEKGKQE